MAKRKTNKKSNKKNVLAKARQIYKQQKNDYKALFKREVKRGDSKKGAIRAGSIYRSRYGRTASIRWANALKKAGK